MPFGQVGGQGDPATGFGPEVPSGRPRVGTEGLCPLSQIEYALKILMMLIGSGSRLFSDTLSELSN